MSETCSNCGNALGYDSEWDDPPRGEGHITVTFNPENEAALVVGEKRTYCSVGCMLNDTDGTPFDANDRIS